MQMECFSPGKALDSSAARLKLCDSPFHAPRGGAEGFSLHFEVIIELHDAKVLIS
jgi:hypothetical protein